MVLKCSTHHIWPHLTEMLAAVRGLTDLLKNNLKSAENLVFADLRWLKFSTCCSNVELYLGHIHDTPTSLLGVVTSATENTSNHTRQNCRRLSIRGGQWDNTFQLGVKEGNPLLLTIGYRKLLKCPCIPVIFKGESGPFNDALQIPTGRIWLWHCSGVSFTDMILVIPAYNSPQTTHCIMKGELGSVTLGSGES